VIALWCRPLSCAGAIDNRFRYVWVQTQSVGIEQPVNRLRTIVNDTEGAISAENDVQLNVTGVLVMVNVSNGCNDTDN